MSIAVELFSGKSENTRRLRAGRDTDRSPKVLKGRALSLSETPHVAMTLEITTIEPRAEITE